MLPDYLMRKNNLMKSTTISFTHVTHENGLVAPEKLADFIKTSSKDLVSRTLDSMRDQGVAITSGDIINTMACFDRDLDEGKKVVFIQLAIGLAYSHPVAFAEHYEQLMNCFTPRLGPSAIFATYGCMLNENQPSPVQSPQSQVLLGSFGLLVEAVTQRIDTCVAGSMGDLDTVHLLELREHLQDSSEALYALRMGHLMVIEHVVDAYMKSYSQHDQRLRCCYQDIFHLIEGYHRQNTPKKVERSAMDASSPHASPRRVAATDAKGSLYLGVGCVGAGGFMRAFFSPRVEQRSTTAVLAPALIVSGGLLIAYHFFSGKGTTMPPRKVQFAPDTKTHCGLRNP